MFDNLSERLERSFKILKGEGKITEINVAETLKDVRRALLDADVNYKVAKTFTDTVKQKALGQNVLTAVKPSQLMVKIVHDELATLMGGETAELNLQGHPAVILMAGLNGAGKTTLSGKLALMLKNKKHKNPLLAACDIYRPAAIEQLRVLGEQIGIPVYSEPDSKDAVAIAQNAIKQAKAKGNDVVIVDTAGRLAVDEQMMQEIAAIKNAIQPDETLFVVDAMTGQDAVNTAKEFNDRLDFDGVVLTKLDGDTRGGAALSIRTVVDKPIKFIGTGEKMEAIDQFHPSRMADRILGMGDIVSLVEKAQEQYDEEEARRLEPVRLQRLHVANPANQEDGQPEGPGQHDSRRGQGHQGHRHRRQRLQRHRSHHQQHDAPRAHQPRNLEHQPPTAHRQRLRHEHPGREPPHQAVRPDAQDDEDGDGQQDGQDDGGHAQNPRNAGNAQDEVSLIPFIIYSNESQAEQILRRTPPAPERGKRGASANALQRLRTD